MNEEADRIIAALNLEPHPEGGHYRETFRDSVHSNGRAHSTAIYFLLKGHEVSRWHRIDAVEVWHWYAGAPMELTVLKEGRSHRHILGTDVLGGQQPQAIVAAQAWQMARSLGAFTLAGCTVSPGFEFPGFELAPEGFTPP
jgi:predicted cupin superfamily sugar epimerase